MADKTLDVTFDPGRVIQGSLYQAQDKDWQGNPLTIKNGPNKGQPTIRYFFCVAYKKTRNHWSEESWGAPIWAFGYQEWPRLRDQRTGLLPDTFAWKIEDGDSDKPNKNQRRNCDNENARGCWLVNFSSNFAPKVFTSTGDPILEPNAVKLGYYVVVRAMIQSNVNDGNPGIYVNHGMVGFVGYGPEIHMGPDPKTVFKGGYALPPGASATPVGGAALPAAAPTPGGALPPPPGSGAPVAPPAYAAPPAAPGAPPAYAAPPAAAGAPPTYAPPPQTAVQPNPAFIAPPGAPGGAPPPPPAAAAPPPPPSGPQMTAAAGAVSYAQFISSGWSEAQMREKGYLV